MSCLDGLPSRRKQVIYSPSEDAHRLVSQAAGTDGQIPNGCVSRIASPPNSSEMRFLFQEETTFLALYGRNYCSS
jgi:hypothetical protein